MRESADAHDGLAGEDDLRTTVDGTPLDLRDLQPTLKAIKTTHKICTKVRRAVREVDCCCS